MTTGLSDRRRAPRYPLSTPVEIDGKERKHRIGVTRDASVFGIQVISRSRFDIGQKIVVRFRVGSPGASTEEVEGRVVRHLIDAEADLWPHVMGVVFERPLAHLANDIAYAGDDRR